MYCGLDGRLSQEEASVATDNTYIYMYMYIETDRERWGRKTFNADVDTSSVSKLSNSRMSCRMVAFDCGSLGRALRVNLGDQKPTSAWFPLKAGSLSLNYGLLPQNASFEVTRLEKQGLGGFSLIADLLSL